MALCHSCHHLVCSALAEYLCSYDAVAYVWFCAVAFDGWGITSIYTYVV